MTNWERELNWLSSGDTRNPFPFEVLDCRAACAALELLTIRETTTQSFTAIENIVQSSQSVFPPADAINVNCAIHIKGHDRSSDLAKDTLSGAGHKWLLQFAEQTLVARRRWTGQTIHVGEFFCNDAGLTVTRLASQRQSVFDDFAYAIAEYELLLNVFLGQRRAAFPVPPGLSRADKTKIALHGWKAHGPIAQFARMLPRD